MTLTSNFHHTSHRRDKIGYIRVNIVKEGPIVGFSQTHGIETHKCFNYFDHYVKSISVNSTILLGSGNFYHEGLIITPLPNCAHYRALIVSINKQKLEELTTHKDLFMALILIPTELMFPKLAYLDLELEIKAIIQQLNGKLNEQELYDELIDYLLWKFS